jgi:lysozyme
MKGAISLAFVMACAVEGTDSIDQTTIVCGVGPTVRGIDVSYYQGNIDWNQVKGAGVEFAFIRVSDGTGFPDPRFATYWAGSRSAGILHGAYQYFRPEQDVIAQADLLLTNMGMLMHDDLPPVLDVEATGGLGPAQVAAKVKLWVDYVTPKIGRAPIIYTGYYFWRDSVGGANMTASPLWHAQYTTAACPNIADPWTSWAFWQYTDTGTVAGISGGTDLDRFNGDRAALDAFIGASTSGTCGDGTCGAGETKFSCPEDCGPCGTISPAGGVIADTDACFEPGGNAAYLRHVSDAGYMNDLIWTHTTESAAESNFANWHLYLAEAGKYKVEVYTATKYAQSKQAKYVVHTPVIDREIVLDQSAADGWRSLGELDLVQGGHQSIHLGDNTGEPLASNTQLVFDAVQLTRVGHGSGSGSGSGSKSDGDDDQHAHHGGCSAGGAGGGLAIVVALVGLRRRRNRV